MKLLLQAALRNSRHLTLAILTFVSLLFLTVANQCEMFSVGLMANTGADFFTLFSPEGKKVKDKISLADIHRRWEGIDLNGDGIVTKQDAAIAIAQRKDTNPLSWVMHKMASHFDFEQNFSLLIEILVGVALFKALTLFASRYIVQLLSIRVTRDLRQQYFEHIQSLPLSFYQEQNLGSLSSRAVGDAEQIASSLNSWLTNYLQTPFTLVSTLFACFYLSWQLSLIIFLGLPLIIFPVVILTRQVKKSLGSYKKTRRLFHQSFSIFWQAFKRLKFSRWRLFLSGNIKNKMIRWPSWKAKARNMAF